MNRDKILINILKELLSMETNGEIKMYIVQDTVKKFSPKNDRFYNNLLKDTIKLLGRKRINIL